MTTKHTPATPLSKTGYAAMMRKGRDTIRTAQAQSEISLPFHRPLEVCDAENVPSLLLAQPSAFFIKDGPLDIVAVVLMPAFENPAGATAKKRATYIAHAANAYPKLVEALRSVLHSGERVSMDNARALLRSLGEE
jgi:predicted ATPase